MTQDGNTVRILFVEDDADLSSSLSTYLSDAGFKVTPVGSCLECYAALTKAYYDVAIVDVSLPDQSGVVLVEFLRTNTSMKIIMMTAHGRIEERVRGYAAGAHNYFVKPVDSLELLAAITSLVNTGQARCTDDPSPPDNAWHLCRQDWQLKAHGGESVRLTSLELSLVELLASVAGDIVSRDTLLQTLYKRNDEHSSRALDSLVRRLRGKIAATGQVSPIKTAHAIGYCFSAPVIIG